VTIHIVDPGIDTGPIVRQALIEIEAGDDLQTLAAKQYRMGTQLMIEAVIECLAGTCNPYQRRDLKSKFWYGPTWREYWRFCANRNRTAQGRQKRLQVPGRE
jgi:methionyl-tRNA formyltransferase